VGLSDDDRDDGSDPQQAADHAEQRDIALLVAQAPGMEGDAREGGGQDGEEQRGVAGLLWWFWDLSCAGEQVVAVLV
jgi:hypothetical protein